MELIAAVAVLAAVHAVGAGESIQTAVAAAQEGDEVVVAPGVYDENIVLTGKNIVLRSTAPENPAVVASTVIDGGGRGSVLTLAGTETAECRIAGLTIRNGAAENGGGINGKGARATVTNCVVTSNSARVGGGGIDGIEGIIGDCAVSRNRGGSAGGIQSTRGGGARFSEQHQIIRCIIEENHAESGVGGISGSSAWVGSRGVIEECIIRSNTGYYGGFECRVIRNSLVYGNVSPAIGAVGGGVALYTQNCTVVDNKGGPTGGLVCTDTGLVFNSIIWGNTGASYPQVEFGEGNSDSTVVENSAVQDWSNRYGRGILVQDPGFMSRSGRDYRLRSTSPCIDRGSVGLSLFWWEERDVVGNSRWQGESVDMGCYEYGGSPDTDGDYLPDSEEMTLGSDELTTDTDGDGLMDGLEVRRGLSPLKRTAPPGIWVPDAGSIREALAMAFLGETVWVRPGVYRENMRVWRRRGVTISSSEPRNILAVDSTIVDAERMGQGFWFALEPDRISTATLRGMTVCNGNEVAAGGVGVGGVLSVGDTVIIEDCSFGGNEVAVGTNHLILRRNRFTGNIGLNVMNCSDSVMSDCTISSNSVAGSLIGGFDSITNCVIVNNQSNSTKALHQFVWAEGVPEAAG